MTDVLVVGGGMAAVVAATRAAQLGRTVVVVRKALGATAMSSGAVDVGAPYVREDGTLEDDVAKCAAAAARKNPVHPFHVLRADVGKLADALRFAAEITSGLLSAPSPKQLFLPTAHGTFKPTAAAQLSQVRGSLSALPSVVGVVDFVATSLIDAAFVAKGLEHDAKSFGKTIRFVPVPSRFFNALEDVLRQPVELAARLDGANAIAEELERVDAAAFLFPPVLGLRSRSVAEALTAALRRPCAELLSEAHGSVPGLRLQRALDEALVRSGARVIDASFRVEKGALFADTEQLDAKTVILATGKFIGGGVRRDGVLTETVFNTPVHVGDRRGPGAVVAELLGERYGDDHDLFRAGVRIDENVRIVGASRRNVFAAGSVIAGFDPAVDGGGLGVAAFTGYLAAERAAAV